MMEDHTKDLKSLTEALGSTLDAAIDSYDGLSA